MTATTLIAYAGDAVATTIHDRGLSIATVAQRAGMPASRLRRRLAGGQRGFTLPEIEALAHAMEIDPWEFVQFVLPPDDSAAG